VFRLLPAHVRRAALGVAVLTLPPVASAQAPAATPTPGAAEAREDRRGRITPSNLRGLGPNGATLRCRDGSYPVPFAPESACDGKGGVMVKFRVIGTPAPVPEPVLPAAPAAVREPAPTRPPSRANEFIPAPTRPQGATLLCRDGTYIVADTSAGRCASHRGVKVRFATPRGR
jgi:hypothetical protein